MFKNPADIRYENKRVQGAFSDLELVFFTGCILYYVHTGSMQARI